MTITERLTAYRHELVDLEARLASLRDEVEMLNDAIYDKQIEIRECEDALADNE